MHVYFLNEIKNSFKVIFRLQLNGIILCFLNYTEYFTLFICLIFSKLNMKLVESEGLSKDIESCFRIFIF